MQTTTWPTWFLLLCYPHVHFPTAQGKGRCKISSAQEIRHISSCVIALCIVSFWLTSIVRSGTTDSTQLERCGFLKMRIHYAVLCLYFSRASFTSWLTHTANCALKRSTTDNHSVLAAKDTAIPLDGIGVYTALNKSFTIILFND